MTNISPQYLHPKSKPEIALVYREGDDYTKRVCKCARDVSVEGDGGCMDVDEEEEEKMPFKNEFPRYGFNI